MLDCLLGKRVLVVDDNPVLAYDIDDALTESGAEVVGPALDLPTGLRLANEHNLDGAVLDIDLCGELVWPLARVLQSHGVPFVLVSADCEMGVPGDLASAQCLSKPAPNASILTSVSKALAMRQASVSATPEGGT